MLKLKITLFFAIFSLFSLHLEASEKTVLIIDADTGNEVDDLYAIVRGLIAPSFEIVGLNSAQWQASQWAIPNTLENSQRLNLEILSYMEMEQIPHPRGASNRLYDWGDDVAQHSAAAYHIIKEAHKMPSGKKLSVAVLGASTNLASALLIDPSIAPLIKAYLIGTTVDPETKVWNKADFNCVMDLHAINVILDAEDLETFIMPINVLFDFTFDINETREVFEGAHPMLDFLYKRWVNHIGGAKYSRIVWDLALIECMIHPELASETSIPTPPENTPREVQVYTSINAPAMRTDFFDSMESYFKK